MIGKISGRLDYTSGDHVLIDCGGVGYLVFCSDRTIGRMPKPGSPVALYTELVVREDLLQLYGFLTLAEKEWHRLLTSVQGVGAKVAMAILGTLGPEGIGRAISLGDMNAVKAAPGVGQKTAQRVVLELKDKAPAVMALGARGAEPAMAAGVVIDTPQADIPAPERVPTADHTAGVDAAAQADALSALVNLGYSHGDAATAIAQAGEGGVTTTQDLIRAALKLLAPKG